MPIRNRRRVHSRRRCGTWRGQHELVKRRGNMGDTDSCRSAASSVPDALVSASWVSCSSMARARLEKSVSRFGGGRWGRACLRSCLVFVAMLQEGRPGRFMWDATVGWEVRRGRGERNGGWSGWSAPWRDNAIYAPARHKQRETGKRGAGRQSARKASLRRRRRRVVSEEWTSTARQEEARREKRRSE